VTAALRPATRTIVLIHGLWMTPLSWEKWVERYEGRGHRVLAPAWPGMEGDVDELRRDPSPMKGLGVKAIVEHYAEIIRGLDEPPIIMGHSFGGAFVQILLDRGLGSAGVAVDSAAVRGILRLPVSTLKATAPVVSNPLNLWRATGLTAEQFHYAFANTLTEAESREAYERYHVPAANRVLFQGALASVNPRTPVRVDFENSSRPPLLLIAGGADHVIPPAVTRAMFRKHHRKSEAVSAHKRFDDRPHLIIGEKGWMAVADYALGWALDPRYTE
jgi:pimeloyl-ACP methyl ester carboxylesterase